MDISRRGFLKIGAVGTAAATVTPKILKAMELELGGRDTSHITAGD
ncbi:MAG: twin-arginine translocation signal domain-containing protein, partial [Deltaproteobacteria bacterium]|nr:twin-arginine translocation signal domain-containing protein [Deltaproteobacteria bacterium]